MTMYLSDLPILRLEVLLRVLVLCLVGAAPGCHVLSPKPIPQEIQFIAPELVEFNKEPVEFGRPIKWLDTVGWVVGIPSKLTLYDRRIDNHRISEKTLDKTVVYLQENNLPHLKVRMNQYAPLDDFRRLRHNKTVAWPYRYTLGVLSVGAEALLPGRLIGGDHFNPFSQTVHLYSDVPATALHELAHAKDFARRKYQGTYGLAYLFMPAWHETIASRDAMDHLYQHGDREAIIEANRILYPAYGTYVGNTLSVFAPSQATPVYYACVLAGHLNGRMLSRDIDSHLREYRSLYATH